MSDTPTPPETKEPSSLELRVNRLEKQMSMMMDAINIMSANMKWIMQQYTGKMDAGRAPSTITTGSPAPTPGVITL